MRSLSTALMLLALFLARPAEAASGLAGIWQGTLGGQPVRVCFNQRDDDDPYGGYYYMSHLQTISLEQAKGEKGVFVEGNDESRGPRPRWQLSVSGDQLSGQWKQAARNLPVKLQRVPLRLKEDETPCGSMTFQQPRLEGIRTITKPAAKDGVGYTRLILDTRGHFGDSINVEIFALAGSSPAIQRINARLREPLAGNPPDWLDCVLMAANSNPYGADHNETYEPRMIGKRWLTVMHHWDGFCGGAHPDASNSPKLFDLTTGNEVNIFAWFTDQAVKREQVDKDELRTLRPAFRTFLLRGWKPEDPECLDAIQSEDYWDIELTRTGFVFTPQLPHVVQACGEDFTLPFAKAATYLSAEGAKNVSVLRSAGP